MLRSKSDLRKIKKSIYENLDLEAVRMAFLECALNDEEFTQESYEEARVIVKLSREHFGHSESSEATKNKFNLDSEIRVPA